MENLHLLDEPILCIKILSLPDAHLDPQEPVDPEFRSIFSEILIPQINPSVIKQIERDIQPHDDIFTILESIRFKFPFYPEFLKKISKYDSFRIKYPRLFTNIVLYSFLSWYNFFVKCRNPEYLVNLLNCLQIINISTNESCIVDYKELSISAFYYCYKLIFRFLLFYNYDRLINPLQTYFSKVEELPLQTYGLLGSVALQVFDVNSKTPINTQKNLLSFITNRVKILGKAFPVNVIDAIFQKIAVSIFNLDLISLQFMNAAFKYAGTEITNLFIIPLIHAITNEINSESVYFDIKPNNTTNTNTKVEFIHVSQYYSPISTNFDNNLNNITEKIIQLEPIKEQSLFSPSFLEKIKLISDSFSFNQNYTAIFVSNYVKIIYDESKVNDYKQYLTFLYICLRLVKKQKFDLPASCLYNDNIFNPTQTVFDCSDDFTQTNVLRAYAIELLINCSQNQIKEVFFDAYSYPYLYSELMMRLSTLNLKISNEYIEQFSLGILDPYLSYRKYDTEPETTARKSILILLASICRDKKLLSQFFSSKVFAERFYSMFYEKQTQTHASGVLRSFLSRASSVTPEFVDETQIFVSSLFNFSELEIIHDVLSIINATIALSPSIATNFSAITENLCKNLAKLPNDASLTVLMDSVTFLAYCSIDHSIQIKELVAVEAAINRITGNDPTTEIRDNLVHIIAGRPLSYILPNFEIKQPKVLPLFVRVFLNSPKLFEILGFLIQLCSESTMNCVKCSEGYFDIFLIDLVDEWRIKGNQTIEIIDKVLQLIVTIVSTNTSPIVVQRFISLMSLVDGEHLPFFHNNVINAFNSMLLKTSKIPSAYMNLDGNSEVNIVGMQESDFGSNLTISFWIYYVNQEDRKTGQNLFWVTDNNYHALKITLKNNLLDVRVYSEDLSYKRDFDLPLKHKSWSQVTVVLNTVVNGPLGCKVFVYCNGSIINNGIIGKFAILSMKPGPVTVKVNQISQKYKNTPIIGMRLSSFDIYNVPFSDDDAALAYDAGPRSVLNHPNRTLHFESQQSNGLFSCKTICNSNIHCECQLKHMKPEPTFATVFVDICNVESVIPLFAQLDIPDANNDKSDLLEEIAVDILKNVLNLGDSAQISFLDVSGFRAIAHLLLAADQSHLTYQLYMRFFGLIQVLTIPELIKQLYSQILLNIEIWIRTPARVHIRILKHWARTIYKLDFAIPMKVRSFPYYVRILRIYYWIQPLERAYIKKERFNGEEVNIKECRRYIYEILDKYIIEGITEYEFNKFMQLLASSIDEEQNESLFTYLHDIAYSPDTPINIKQMIISNVNLLIKCIDPTQDAKSIAIIRTIVQVYNDVPNKRKELPDIVIRLMYLFNRTYATEFVYQHLKLLIQSGITELFPLACWNAIILGENRVNDLITSLDKSMNYYFEDYSLVYPILACYTSEEITVNNLIDFIVRCFPQKWKESFYLINLFGRILNMITEGEYIQNKFLTIMCYYLMQHSLPISKHISAFQIAFRFIFFRPMPMDGTCHLWNPALEELYVKSSFCNQKIQLNYVSKLKLIERPEHLPYMINAGDQKVYFGLRLNEVGKWADSALVSTIVFMMTSNFEKISSSPLNVVKPDDMLLLCAYLYTDDPTTVEEFLAKNIKIVNKEGLALIYTKIEAARYDTRNAPPLNLTESEKQYAAQKFLEREANIPYKKFDDEIVFGEDLAAQIVSIFRKHTNPKILRPDDVLGPLKDSIKDNVQENEKLWINMWRSLTQDRAPWNSSLPPSSRKIVRFKRDNGWCGTSFCPYKMRRNFAFDDHMEASLIRDRGDVNIAKQIVENRKRNSQHRSTSSIIELPDGSRSPKAKKEVQEIRDRQIFRLPCRINTCKSTVDAFFTLFSERIVIQKSQNSKRIVIQKDEITGLLWRTYRHILLGMEIFLDSHRSYLIYFDNDPTQIINHIIKSFHLGGPGKYFQTTDFKTFFASTGLTNKWVKREITTFEYLMYLNIFSGRTFSNPSQYPVFPWVLKDFQSKEIDFKNTEIFRDFSKPVGAFTEARLKELKMKYDELVLMDMDPYLYGNGYINPLSVYLWLLRIEPFTTLHIDMQGGRFDHASRLFFSLADSYRLISEQQGDFRELVPEFFFMPEFLLNCNEFDLGSSFDMIISDVVMPPWAKDAFEFIYLHRKALESDYVSEHINEWIDLIWGNKRYGQAAIDANNVFRKELYEEIWDDPNNKNDEFLKIDIEMNLDQIGQIPPQLFNEAHPKRDPIITEKKYTQSITYKINPNGTLKAASISTLNANNGKITFFTLTELQDSLHIISQYEVDIVTIQINLTPSLTKETDRNVTFLNFSSTKTTFCIKDDLTEIKLINFPLSKQQNMYRTIKSHAEVVSCTTDEVWTVLAGNDASISIQKTDSVPSIVRTYRNTITCMAVSRSFDQIVAGTRDRCLLFISLSRGTLTNAVDVKDGLMPHSVLITKSMGFVLVDAMRAVDGDVSHVFLLYNINGLFMREFDADFDFSCWSMWTSLDGFDNVVVADTEGVLRIGEVFNIDKGLSQICKCNSTVLSLKFIPEMNSLFAICSNGEVLFVPI